MAKALKIQKSMQNQPKVCQTFVRQNSQFVKNIKILSDFMSDVCQTEKAE